MIRIIFSDVDGTLLNSEHVVTPQTRQAILELQDIPFVIVSARSPAGIYPIQKKNGFHTSVIAFSGALIQDENRNILYQKGMEVSLAAQVIEFIEREELPLTWCVFSGEEWIVKDRSDPKIIREEQIVEAESTQGTIDSLNSGQAVHKILCICDPGTIDRTQECIRRKFQDINVVKSSDILIEIMDRDVNKAKAVKIYCELSGIDEKEAAAFGDNYNDVEMLETVGYGILMGNAPDDLKERFAYITSDNDHDGIAKALKKKEWGLGI